MDRDFLTNRIAIVQAQIVAYEDMLSAFASDGAIQSYSLDTGQSRQTVSRSQLASVRILLDGLYNRLATFEARLYGSSITARPGW